jgi:hypothetical protein
VTLRPAHILEAVLILGAVLLSGCQNLPEPYVPPEQRQPFDHFEPYHITRIVNMADGDANQHFVKDILGDTGPWRWTVKHPEVRMTMRTNQGLRYVIDFSIVQTTFKDTGPLRFSFYVNGHVLDTQRYDTEGNKHFEKAVPAEWVEPGKETILGAEVDKLWYSPADHQPLGFILTRIGLTQ